MDDVEIGGDVEIEHQIEFRSSFYVEDFYFYMLHTIYLVLRTFRGNNLPRLRSPRANENDRRVSDMNFVNVNIFLN